MLAKNKCISCLGVFFSLGVLVFSDALSAQSKTPSVLSRIEANYIAKTGFISIPVSADIILEQVSERRFRSTTKVRGPFFNLDQTEEAEIKNCSISILSTESKGKRKGSDEWEENIELVWPEKTVKYSSEKFPDARYRPDFTPIAAGSLAANLFFSGISEGESTLFTYIQHPKGRNLIANLVDKKEKISNQFYKKKAYAQRWEVRKHNIAKEGKAPAVVWMQAESLGIFPLRVMVRRGMIAMNIYLKDLSIDPGSEAMNELMQTFGCSSDQS